jgi:hypothetical protein
MIDSNLKTQLINLMDSEKKQSESFFSYLRHLSTISIGFLGLLVGLKPEHMPNCNSKFFFIVTVVFLSLGILFLTILSYYETLNYQKEISLRKKQIKEYDIEKGIQIDHLPQGNLKYFIPITFCFLALSIISLMIYVYFSTI